MWRGAMYHEVSSYLLLSSCRHELVFHGRAIVQALGMMRGNETAQQQPQLTRQIR